MSGFFGSGDKKTYTTSNTQSSDMRTVAEGSIGTLISPGASVATPGGGAVNAAPGATVNQAITNSGFTADDVTTLVQQLETDRAAERGAITSLGSNLAAGLRDQSQMMADIVAATKAPDDTMMRQLLPVLLLLGLLYFLTRWQ